MIIPLKITLTAVPIHMLEHMYHHQYQEPVLCLDRDPPDLLQPTLLSLAPIHPVLLLLVVLAVMHQQTLFEEGKMTSFVEKEN